MQLLSEELLQQLPSLYTQENGSASEQIVYAKFFLPGENRIWFAIEGGEKDGEFVFFGYVIGSKAKWDFFTLNELQTINTNGVTVERDKNFKPRKFGDVLAQFRQEYPA